MRLVIATRRSALALAQSSWVAAALRAGGHEVELLQITTSGDRWSATGTGEAPGKGLFTKELEEALLDGRAHLAVHSAKDVPTDLPIALAISAVPERENPADVLVGATSLAGLPVGARVGTGSPRRAAQLAVARADLEVVEIRGNVDTRLAKRDRGEVDALVLAAAGLARLGIVRPDIAVLPIDVSTPAPGQGCLAIETRRGASDVIAALRPLSDAVATRCLEAERALLARLGGGCMAPVGALCTAHPEGLRMVAFRANDASGAGATRITITGPLKDPAGLGSAAAHGLGLV